MELLDRKIIKKDYFDALLREINNLKEKNSEQVSMLDYVEIEKRKRDFFAKFNAEVSEHLRSIYLHSKSQLMQDLFVLAALGFKENGFFVEFGATNGLDLSNTFLLEYGYGWDGVLAEPAKCWSNDLNKNRKVSISNKCVWSESGRVLNFNEAETPELSTIEDFTAIDHHANSRSSGNIYQVETISLEDLLCKNGAPKDVDFLSIDTEGSEFEVLSNHDFTKYDFKIICCEHNYTPEREKIYNLLVSKGYRRVMCDVSYWDDWFIKENLLKHIPIISQKLERVVLQLSSPRTGSTLVYNALCGLLVPCQMLEYGDPQDYSFRDIDAHTIVIKSHELSLNKWLEVFQNKEVILVSTNRAGFEHPKDVFPQHFLNWSHVEISYEELMSKKGVEEQIQFIANGFAKDANLCLDTLRQDLAIERIRQMNKKVEEYENKPFEIFDMKFGIHGGHRNRG